MRLATLKRNYWQLRSGDAPTVETETLQRGQSAQLMFEIEALDESGLIHVTNEPLWVTIAERYGYFYIGILETQPACCAPDDDSYLCSGAEIPFFPEHVFEFTNSSPAEIEQHLGPLPERRWPRH